MSPDYQKYPALPVFSKSTFGTDMPGNAVGGQ